MWFLIHLNHLNLDSQPFFFSGKGDKRSFLQGQGHLEQIPSVKKQPNAMSTMFRNLLIYITKCSPDYFRKVKVNKILRPLCNLAAPYLIAFWAGSNHMLHK